MSKSNVLFFIHNGGIHMHINIILGSFNGGKKDCMIRIFETFC